MKSSKIGIHPLWYICILVRVIIALLPLIYYYLSRKNNKYSLIYNISLVNKYIILTMGLGFLYKAIFGSNNESQVRKIFWHETRIIHAVLFITAGLYFDNYKFSSALLFVSVLFSLVYRFSSGHFK